MIPMTLELTNFLSYRKMDQPLDFSGIHLACLSGANGNGKSALLDAITWVLWGKARGCEGGHEQERLIRDGADQAHVEMTFELDGQLYRVSRSRTRKGKGDLHLQVAGADGSWTDMAGESVTTTQSRISSLLKMEYEVFTKSAYILQGRADEFSTLDPSKRKDVLAKILGLEIYERLADRAKEYKKENASLAEASRSDAERFEAELVEVPELEEKRSAAETAAAGAEARRAVVQAQLDEAQRLLGELTTIESHVRRLEEQKSALETTVQRTQEDIAAQEREMADAKRAASVDDAVRALAAEVPPLEQRDHLLEEARARNDQISAGISDLERRIAVERERLTGQRRTAQTRLDDAQRELETVAGAAERLTKARGTLEVLSGAAEQREGLLERHKELGEEKARLESEIALRDTQRGELTERGERLSEADADCPLCEQPLTAAHRQKIGAETKERLAGLAAADKAATKAIRVIEKEIAAVVARGLEIKAQLEQRDEIAGRVAALEQKVGRIGEINDRITAAQARVLEIDAIISTDADSPTEREKLASFLTERAEIGYEPEMHKRTRAELDRARRADATLQVAAQASVLVDSLARSLEGARIREAESRESLRAVLAEISERGAALVALPERTAAVEALRSDALAAAQAIVDAKTAAARAQERLDALMRTAERAKETRSKQADAMTAAGRYEELAKVFGRDGIPARIIGNAIPELQQEANKLLELLTDGRLSLALQLTRPTKARTIKETLDITVSDTQGIRAYEMYSGGEKLRIDFALRIALSGLLARRANTRLETLVIDEGFGSQDAEGRARLVEAIFRVQDHFRRVLVITHVEELKDQFPVRIEVEKDAVEGSRVRVS